MDLFEISRGKRLRDDDELKPMLDFTTRVFYDEVVYTIETTRPEVPEAAEATVLETAKAAVPEASDSESEADDDSSFQITAEDFYNKFVNRTHEQCISELQAPQRSVEWLEARRHCITASSFGAAVGHNKYSSPRSVALDKLWNTFKGNAFTAYGTFHESDAQKSFVNILNGPLNYNLKIMYRTYTNGDFTSFQLFECGLLKHYKQPWMAVSPDGLLRLNGTNGGLWLLVEYKCPARLRDSSGHPYATSSNNIPDYYFDQMQGIMGLFNKFPDLIDGADKIVAEGSKVPIEGPEGQLMERNTERLMPAAFFIVWQPRQVHVTRVPYKHEYYANELEPKLENWFFETYLPLAVLKHNGSLVPGTDTTAPVIEIS
jgi:hypothetical protein